MLRDEEKGEQPPSYEATSPTTPPQYTSDPPPAYDTVVGKIGAIREKSDGNTELAKNLCAYIFCGTVASIITIACTIGIPIAHITIGAIYLDDCPRERMIPIYLVVAGCFLLVKAFMGISEMVHKRKSGQSEEEYQRPKMFQCCDGPVGCFLFAWFIAGNVWIFRIHNDYKTEDPLSPEFCNSTLYLYAFWMMIAGYIIVGAVMVLCCAVCLIACCCAAAKVPSNNEDS